MPSLFPGMNPYIEEDDVWHDFHERFLPAAAEAIGIQVQPDYIAKIDEHVYVHESESFLEIRDRRSRELVCVLELLSPVNKRPCPDREQYLAKRGRVLNSPALLAEIDLLRIGDPCRRRIGPLAPSRSLSVELRIMPWPISGRSDCGTRCQ